MSRGNGADGQGGRAYEAFIFVRDEHASDWHLAAEEALPRRVHLLLSPQPGVVSGPQVNSSVSAHSS